jgi:hypothetical protein
VVCSAVRCSLLVDENCSLWFQSLTRCCFGVGMEDAEAQATPSSFLD